MVPVATKTPSGTVGGIIGVVILLTKCSRKDLDKLVRDPDVDGELLLSGGKRR